MRINKLLNFKQIDIRLILIINFFLCYFFTFFLESIPVYDGKGYDGQIYFSIATNGLELIRNKVQIGYYVFRSFPFIIYNLLNLPNDNVNNVLMFFKIFNISTIVLSVIYYFKLCAYFKFNRVTGNIGFILMFFNFPILKLVNYYPLLTDHFSFMLSIVGVYYIVNFKNWKLLITILISLFFLISFFLILAIDFFYY
jgi:hypothetical protein